MKKEITITPVRVADLLAEGARMQVYVQIVDHPDMRVLVDTGMTELRRAPLEPGSPPYATSSSTSMSTAGS